MSGGVADFTVQDENALLNVDRAHKAVEKTSRELEEALLAAQRKVYEQFSPLLFECQSVLYEAMGKAARAGFSYEDMAKTMGCANH